MLITTFRNCEYFTINIKNKIPTHNPNPDLDPDPNPDPGCELAFARQLSNHPSNCNNDTTKIFFLVRCFQTPLKKIILMRSRQKTCFAPFTQWVNDLTRWVELAQIIFSTLLRRGNCCCTIYKGTEFYNFFKNYYCYYYYYYYYYYNHHHH